MRSRINLQRHREERKARDRYLLALSPSTRGKNLPQTVSIDGEVMVLDDRDGAEFKVYMKLIENILREANGSMLSLREIKAALGDQLVERWLIDALFFSHHVLTIEQPGFNRYTYVEKITVAPRSGDNSLHLANVGGAKWPDWQDFSRP